MQRCTTRFFPGTLDYMGFELRNEGLRIILSPEIPPFIKKRIKPTLEGFLQECQLSAESLSHFVMHPRQRANRRDHRQSVGPESGGHRTHAEGFV